MIQRKHTLHFDTMNFTPDMAEIFFKLISQISLQKNYINTSESIVLAVNNYYERYNITLTFPILVLHGDKRSFQVVEPIESNLVYSNETSKDKSLEFSFLKVYHCLGELEVNNCAFKFLPHKIPYFHFLCEKVIDPKQATMAQRIFLHDLFTTIYREKIQDETYGINRIENGYLKDNRQLLKLKNKEGYIAVDINLRFSVSLRNSLHYLDEYRADVLDHKLSKGSFAWVRSISGTFKRSAFFAKTNNPKVLKDYVISIETTPKEELIDRRYTKPSRLIKTVKLTNLTDHIESSPPVAYVTHDSGEHWINTDKGTEHWQTRETDCFLASERIELLDYMKKNPLYFKKDDGSLLENEKITIDDVLELFCETALALQRFHFKNLVHKDIKPENLIIDRNKKCLILDFNLSKEITKNDKGKFAGTLSYISPEQFIRERSGFKSDVFNLLRTWIIWFEGCMAGRDQARSADIFVPLFPFLKQLVSEKKISIEHSNLLIDMFKEGFEFDYNKRSDLENILTIIDEIILARNRERAQEKLSPELMVNFDLAQTYAIKFRTTFLTYTRFSLLNTKLEAYFPRRMIDMPLHLLEELKKAIIAKLNELEDNIIIMKEFCQMSRIEAIRELEKKDEIRVRIEIIFDEYIDELRKLILLFNQSNDKNEKNEIQELLNLQYKYSFNLENMTKLTNRFSKFHEKKSKNNLKINQESNGLLKNHLLLFSLESRKKLNNSSTLYDKIFKFLSKS